MKTESQNTVSRASDTKFAKPMKLAALADLGVGHAEPEPEPERIGEKHEQDHGRRNYEPDPKQVAAVGRIATPHFVFGSGRQPELVPSSIDLEATPATRRRAAEVQIS